MNSVYSPLRCVRSLRKKNKKQNMTTSSLKQELRVQRGWESTMTMENEKTKIITSVSGSQVSEESSCCHIPSPHEIQPNICQVKDILLFHGIQLAKDIELKSFQ